MEKIYCTGYDHDVKGVIVYAIKPEWVVDTLLYLDLNLNEQDNTPADAKTIHDLFVKNMLIVAMENEDGHSCLYRPTYYREYDGAVMVGDTMCIPAADYEFGGA